jgi:hypothetical protein
MKEECVTAAGSPAVVVDGMDSSRLRIGLVTPFAWDQPSAVNRYVARLARELLRRGHRPVVVASSGSHPELRRMRSAFSDSEAGSIRSLLAEWYAGDELDASLLPLGADGCLRFDDGVPVAIVGRAFTLRTQGRVVGVGLPIDLTLRLERFLEAADFDLLHVHEPMAPSLGFSAIRLARCPVVGTFHLTPAGSFSYEAGRSFIPHFFERLDVRLATSVEGASVLADLLGEECEVQRPWPVVALPEEQSTVAERGESDARLSPEATFAGVGEPADLLYVVRGDDRKGLRALYRALGRHAGSEEEGVARSPGPMVATGPSRVLVAFESSSRRSWRPPPVPRYLRRFLEIVTYTSDSELLACYDRSSAVCLPLLGGEWLHESILECALLGKRCVGPDLPLLREYVEMGWLHAVALDTEGILREEAGSVSGLPAGVFSLPQDAAPVAPSCSADAAAAADLMIESYRRVAERGGRSRLSATRTTRMPRYRRRASSIDPEGRILVDLHVHTNHSGDCASNVKDVLAAARQIGLGGLAIADHNTIAGALEAAEAAAAEDDGFIVIVGEEVKTQDGEVIGLFLTEEIPPGLTFEETVAMIKAQGALVYVPHPFDRLHFTPPYEILVRNADRIDAIEIYNARLALESFNAAAERFAHKYGILGGAGSDSHVLAGLGTAMVRMRPFSGPKEFRLSLSEADVLSRRKSVLYVQSLKLIKNTLDRVLPQR